MKEMMLAGVAMLAISIGASFALKEAGFSAADQTSGAAVRLD